MPPKATKPEPISSIDAGSGVWPVVTMPVSVKGVENVSPCGQEAGATASRQPHAYTKLPACKPLPPNVNVVGFALVRVVPERLYSKMLKLEAVTPKWESQGAQLLPRF